MSRSDPSPPPPGEHEPADAGIDPLVSQLRERLRELEAATARLRAEAPSDAREGDAARSASDPPPGGWQRPAPDGGAERAAADTLAELLRGALPTDLARQLAEAVRELLLAVRALIDWCLERLERRGRAPVEVQDIPIV